MTEKRKNDDLTLWGVIIEKIVNVDAEIWFAFGLVLFLGGIFVLVVIAALSQPSEIDRLAAFMTDCRAQEITQATCERLAIEFFGG